MNCVKAAMFRGSADPTMDDVLHRGKQGSFGSVCFEATSFFFAEVPPEINRASKPRSHVFPRVNIAAHRCRMLSINLASQRLCTHLRLEVKRTLLCYQH